MTTRADIEARAVKQSSRTRVRKEGRMGIAAERRFLVLLTIALLAIVVLSLISFEVVSHMTVILQAFHGIADSGPNILQHHP